MRDEQEKIRVGVIGRAHGVHGAVRVFMDDEGSDSLLNVKIVYLGSAGDAFRVIRATRCGRFVALELDGIDDRDRAFELTGREVRVMRRDLRPLRDAYYACDLVGLELRDGNGKTWGVVDDVIPGSAHDLLRYVRAQGGEGYVPFVAAHVMRVDIEAGIILVDADWMAGLDEVYGA